MGIRFDYRFRIFQGSDAQWYIAIEHVNGQALYTSEGYTREESAVLSLENFLDAVMQLGEARLSIRAQDLVTQHTISK